MKTSKKTTNTSSENEPKKSKRIGLTVKVSKSKPVKKDKTEFEKKEKIELEELSLPQVEKDKIVLMWSGVAFFMIVIVGFWFFSIRQSIGNFKLSDKDKSFDWSELNKIADEFTKNIDLTKEQIASMKVALSAQGQELATTTIASSTPVETSFNSLPTENKINQQDLDRIKQELLEINRKSN